jgi:hypothetical protein
MNVSAGLSAFLVISVITAISAILLVAISSVGVNNVFADDYEKSQTIVQTNECGNYWFPLDILCSNLGSQTQGDENSISVASAQEQEDENVESSNSYGPPFP